MKKINIGSGIKPIKDGDNLDTHKKYGANIIWDLNNLPIKIIKDNTYDYILCEHVLEDFVKPVPVIEEFIRIAKPGAIINISVPNSTYNWENNICHAHPYSLSQFKAYLSMDSYDQKVPLELVKYEYYQDDIGAFHSRVYAWISTTFWNIMPPSIMQFTCLKFLFPFVYLRVIFRVKKSK